MPNPPKAPEGTVIRMQDGTFQVKRNGSWVASNESGAPNTDTALAEMTPGAESRVRLGLGFGPAVTAQRGMETAEAGGPNGTRTNPLNRDWGAATLDAIPDWGLLSPAARTWGGDDYQQYTQAAKSFEAAVLPVLSGAAVTESEASRQIRANLPELGDTPQTLERKARNRSMMLNAAADLLGRPRPFPAIGTWDGGALDAQAPAPTAPPSAAPRPSASPAPTGATVTDRGQRITSVRYADMTPAQAATARRTSRNPGQYGTATRPYAPRNAGDYARLPPGAFYIFTDGSVMQKPGGN